MECYKCGQTISEKATYCDKCGTKQDKSEKKLLTLTKSSNPLATARVVAVIIMVGLFFGFISNPESNNLIATLIILVIAVALFRGKRWTVYVMVFTSVIVAIGTILTLIFSDSFEGFLVLLAAALLYVPATILFWRKREKFSPGFI